MAIPQNTLVPGSYTSFDTTSQTSTLPGNNQSIAIIAQKLAAGTADQNTPIQVFTEGDVVAQAGAGSVAHLMAKSALSSNRNIDLFMVYQDDVAGTKALGIFTATGTATAAGTLVLWIANNRVEVSVANTDTANDVAAAIAAAVNAAQNVLPVTGASALAVATVTSRNSGTIGNSIPLAADDTGVEGISVAVVQMSTGATDPVFQDALDSLTGTDVRNIAPQWGDATNLATLEQFLRDESEPIEGRRRLGWAGSAYVTVSTVNSLANGVDYERVSIGYARNTLTELRGKYTTYEIGAAYVAAYTRITDPAQPRNGEILGGMPTTNFNDVLNPAEKQSLLENGVTPLVTVGNQVEILRSVSTKTTTNSVTDLTLIDIQKQDSLDFVASSLESMYKINFSQTKITDRTIAAVRSKILAQLYLIEELEIVRNVDENQDGVIVKEKVGAAPGTLQVSVPARIVDGLHVIDQEIILISI